MSTNRRKHERLRVAVAAEVELDGEVLMGETRDVSMGGVSAILAQVLEEGSSLPLTLILTQDGIEDPAEDPFEAEATVMWVAPTDAGQNMTGLKFNSPGDDQSARLERFLAALEQ